MADSFRTAGSSDSVRASFPYALSDHAAKVIAERDIELDWIVRVLSRPRRTESDPDDPALRHAIGRIPEYGNRVLRVVYNEHADPWRIVTAYFDRSLRNLL